jgi:ATP-dependent Clp protease ATP-binding subunit ClpB
MSLLLTEDAREFIAASGYDLAYGARPIKRALQRLVADPLALAILEGRFADGATIRVDVNGHGLRFEKGTELSEDEAEID